MQDQYDPAEPMRTFTSAWVRSSSELSKSVARFWRAATPGVANGHRTEPEADDETTVEGDDAGPYVVAGPDVGREAAIEPSMAYSDETWTVERTVERTEDIGVGDEVRFSKRLTEKDVESFAYASGDTNRLHLDEAFAAESRFGGRIAHGTLVSGTISAALARLPGLTIYLSQDLRFLKPVEIGERVTAICEIVEDLGGDRYRLTTRVEREDGEVVVDGEAIVLIDEPPAEE
jgi:acyl dehydratase